MSQFLGLNQIPSDLPRWKRIFEYVCIVLIFYSIFTYYLEIEVTGSHHSTGWWLWSERFVAIWFTFEYFFRWAVSHDRKGHPFRFFAIVDLISILPFWIGFAVDLRTLRLVRTLRILRLLKLYRYNLAVQNVLRGFTKVKEELAVVGFVVVVMILFSSVAMFEFEHDAQPDKFRGLSDGVWWSVVTLTTVGYGDITPITLGGRIIGLMTMIVGIGVFSTLISLIGSSFVASMKEEENREQYDKGLVVGDLPIPAQGTQSDAGVDKQVREAAQVGTGGN